RLYVQAPELVDHLRGVLHHRGDITPASRFYLRTRRPYDLETTPINLLEGHRSVHRRLGETRDLVSMIGGQILDPLDGGQCGVAVEDDGSEHQRRRLAFDARCGSAGRAH